MTALDPLTAERVLAVPSSAFTSATWGDVTFIPTTSPHPVDGAGYVPVIPRDTGDGASDLTADIGLQPTVDYVLVLALTGLDQVVNPLYWEVVDGGAWFTLVLNSENVVYADFSSQSPVTGDVPYPNGDPDAGIQLIALSANSTETRVFMHGQGTIATAGARGSVGSPQTLVFSDQEFAAGVAGMWMWENVEATETDLEDTLAALYATLVEPVFTNEAVGYTQTYGTAAGVSADTLPETPDAPTLTPGGSQEPPEIPPFVIPDNVPDAVIRRISQVFDAPDLEGTEFPVNWSPTSEQGEEYARLQIVVEGEDITWLNGAPTPMPSWSRVEPFGSYSAVIELPQVSIFHAPPTWAKGGANVEIQLVKLNDDPTVKVFTGAVVKVGRREDSRAFTLTCHGVMFLGDLQLRLPGFKTAPRDIGSVAAEVLNSVVSKRYTDVATVTTGCMTSVLGAWEPRLSGYVQTLLATAITGGEQWTVKCEDRAPVIQAKDTTTVHWVVRAGQPGIDIDLEDDIAESPNIIYGEGTREDGGHWRNAKYPNWRPDDTPAYPYTDPDTTIRVGTTDAMTDTGNGVSVWQAKVGQPVTGYFSTGDRTALRALQTRAGITVDGILGPQSWAATFDTGANTGTLDGAFIAPLAAALEVMPRLYGPQGDDLGPNPDYDPGVLVVDRKINFGQGVALADAQTNAQEILARDSGPGWQGSIDLTLDPPGGSKYEILEGQNVRVLGWGGDDPLLHIAAVDVNAQDLDAPVRLTVDTKARDYPTLDAIRNRQRDAVDPARIAYDRLTAGQIQSDSVTYDAESPGGIMPRHPVFSNLWDVRKIPMGAYGDIVKTDFRTTDNARAFSLAVFGKSITAAQLLSIVGNPLTTSANESPWDEHADELAGYAMIQAWGWNQQPAGYSPRSKTNPGGATSAPITGRLLDETSFTYASSQVPWIWVATIATNSCYVEGRFYGGRSD